MLIWLKCDNNFLEKVYLKVFYYTYKKVMSEEFVKLRLQLIKLLKDEKQEATRNGMILQIKHIINQK